MFGIGFGAFSVMDWALATDVLPNKEEFAKDMGIWSLAMVLPQVVAAPIAGVLLDWGQVYQSHQFNTACCFDRFIFCPVLSFLSSAE
jgi:MFS family permease